MARRRKEKYEEEEGRLSGAKKGAGEGVNEVAATRSEATELFSFHDIIE
jgi:hypothetical protein